MAGKQARGRMTLHLDINNAAVGYKLRTIQRQIHQVSRAWKAQAHTLWIAGQREEALRIKMQGVQKEHDLEKKYVDRATASIKASNKAHEQGNKKYQRLKINRDAARQQLQEYTNQVEHTKNVLVLHNNELLKTSRIEQSNTREGQARVEALQAEGRETDANKQKTANYNMRLKDLKDRLRAVYVTIREAKHDGLNSNLNPDYTKQRSEYFRLKAAIAGVTHEQKDFNSGLTTGKHYDDVYNQTTNKLIASLKRMKQSAQANRVEYKRLSDNQQHEAQTLQRAKDKLAQVAHESGVASTAFQKEYSRVTSLNTKYNEHIRKIGILCDTYGRMSSRVAAGVDEQRSKIRQLSLTSHRELVNAHSLAGASFALGAGFIYGAHKAMALENEFNKVRNLLNTSGESYRQSTKEIKQMGDATQKYSMQYGVSQDEISKGYGALVRRGYTGNQALASQKTYLQGAIASGDKYSDVMNTAASTLEAFGMRSNNTGKMIGNTKTAVNQLAYSADLTATDFSGIGYGMKMTGATAHSASQSLSETASALGVLSNNGQDATNAGFGLRKVLNSFIASKDTKAWRKILPQMGLSASDFQDAQGHFKSLSTMMDTLNSHMQGMSQAKKTDIFHQLFGATGQESALILARNTGNLSKLNKQVSKSQNQGHGDGYAARIARKNMNSTENQMKRLRRAGNYLAQSYAQGLNPEFKRLADAGLAVSNVFRIMPKGIKNFVTASTAAIPVITAINFGLSAFNKIHALEATTSLRMMGISRDEQIQLKAKATDTNQLTDATKQYNLSVAEATRLERQKQEADTDESNAQKGQISTTNSDTDAVKTNNTANATSNTESETLATRHPSTLGFASNHLGGSIGTGFAGKAALRYGAAGAGMGILTGGTEALNGNVRGGAEDAVGIAGGTALGGVAAGPMGAMIGGIAGPMIARSVGNVIKKTSPSITKTGLKSMPKDTIGESQTRQFDNNLKGISSSSQKFVKNEAALESKATSQIAMDGGKIGKNAVGTYNKILDLARKYGAKEVQIKDKSLKSALNKGLLSKSDYQQAVAKVNRNEQAYQQKLNQITNRLITTDRKADKKDVTQREKDLNSLNKYILKLTNSGYNRLKKLRKNIMNQDNHLSRKQYGNDLKMRKRDYHSAIKLANRRLKSSKKSLKDNLLTIKNQDGANSKAYKDAKKNYSHILGVYKTEHGKAVSSAKSERDRTGKAIDERTSHAVKKEYQQTQRVRRENAKREANNKRFERDDGKSQTWLDHHHKENLWYQKEYQKRTLSSEKSFWSSVWSSAENVLKHPIKTVKEAFATGTPDTQAVHLAVGNLSGISRSENAVVNDGGGRELVKLPNGQLVLPSGHNVHTILPKGSSVFNANQTRRLLGLVHQPATHHAAGTVSNLPKGIKNTLNIKLPDGSFKKTEKNTKKSMKNIHDLIDKGYKKSNKDAQSHLDDFHDHNDNSWDDTKDITKKHVKDIHDDTVGRYNDLKTSINNTQNRSNQLTNAHLNTTVSYFRHHFAMIPPISRSSMQSGVNNINAGISSIDRVLSEFGGNNHVLSAVHYATGTTGPSLEKQLAVLNDAHSGPRQEAIVSDQGRVRMPIGQNALTMLNPGDKVLNGSDTLRAMKTGLIPHYAGGKQSDEALKKLAKHYAKTPSSFTGDTFNKLATVIGSVLSKGITQSTKNGAQKPADNWSNAMWKYIDTLINPDNSELVKKMHSLGDGKRYKWSANGPSTYDCSGLVHAALSDLHISSPRLAGEFKDIGKVIPKSEAGPGDIVESSKHVGVVDSQGAGSYFSAFSDSARPNILTQPLDNAHFTPGHPYWFVRVPQLARDNGEVEQVKNNPLTPRVKRQLGRGSAKWIQSHLGEDAGSMSNPAGDSVTRWIPQIHKALDVLHQSRSETSRILRQIVTESQGDPNVIGGTDGLNDGHSMGLMQVKPGTFAANAPRGGKWNNGYDSIYAGIKYAMKTYGSLGVLGNSHGYANGGLSDHSKFAHISEGDKPEMILPLTNKSRAVELMLKSLQFMFGGQQNKSQQNTSNQTSAADRQFERELIQSNKQKDFEINKLVNTTNNILTKMSILIKTVQNKPVISNADIYRGNRKVAMSKMRLRNYNRGTF